MAEAPKSKIDQILEWLEKSDYYQILNVAPNANSVELKAAYFRLSRQYHPDRYFSTANKDVREKINTVFKRVNEAYQVLKASDKRKRYDKALNSPERAQNLRYQGGDEDRGPASPESNAKTENGRKYLKLAWLAQQKKDWRAAEMNLKFALGYEADNEYMKKMMDTVKTAIAKLPKEDPFKIR